MPIPTIHLHHHRVAERRMWATIAEDDPAVGVSSLAASGPGHVDGLVTGEAQGIALAEDGHGASCRLVVQEAIVTTRRILGAMQDNEEHGAERDPRGVEPEKAASHARYHTQP